MYKRQEYYTLKTELATLQEQLSAYENAGGRAQKFLKLTERYAAFTDLTPAILNEFISRIEVHARDKKRAKQAVQHIGISVSYTHLMCIRDSDIAVAQRLGITATTLEGILTVKGQGRR